MENIYLNISDIRREFIRKFVAKEIVTNDTGSLSGADTIEIVGASFIADEPTIFGKPNEEYIARELEWYKSMSLNVNDIPGITPKIWKSVATPEGLINSNYGYLVFHEDNFRQAENVIETLIKSPSSRRATMIYNRPSMHKDFCEGGKQDFCCTNAVQYLIRDNKLDVIVQMRSNDAIFGFANDFAWQEYMHKHVLQAINFEKKLSPDWKIVDRLELGKIYWQVSSLHIYERHFYYIENLLNNE
jgi:thymidylate synthase